MPKENLSLIRDISYQFIFRWDWVGLHFGSISWLES